MAVNKVTYGGETLIDLTGDTVTADKLLQGITAHDKSGASIIGELVAAATKTAMGTISWNGLTMAREAVISHDLGVAPNFAVIFKMNAATGEAWITCVCQDDTGGGLTAAVHNRVTGSAGVATGAATVSMTASAVTFDTTPTSVATYFYGKYGYLIGVI